MHPVTEAFWISHTCGGAFVNLFYLLSHGADQLLILQPVVASFLLELLFQSLELIGHGSLHLYRLQIQTRREERAQGANFARQPPSCVLLSFRPGDEITEIQSVNL